MNEHSMRAKDMLVNPTQDDIRAGMELANRMIWAVDPRNRASQYAGGTWGDFKKAVEALGVTDTTNLGSIEYGTSQFHSGYVVVNDDDLGAADIRELPR